MLHLNEQVALNNFGMCSTHRRNVSLYCKKEECQTEICPSCMVEKHSNHNVINLFHERKRELVSEIEILAKDLDSYKNQLMLAEEEVCEKFEESVAVLKDKREKLLAEMAGKKGHANAVTSELNVIAQNITEDTTFNEVTLKAQVIEERRSALAEDICKPVKYPFYCLTEKEYEVDLLRKTVGIKIGKYIKEVTHSIKTNYTGIDAVQVLSDGTIAIRGRQLDEQTKLTQYDLHAGNILFGIRLGRDVVGLAKVLFAGEPCLAVSYRETAEEGGRIDFHDDPNLCKVKGTFTKEDVKTKGEKRLHPGTMSNYSPTGLIYVENGDEDLKLRTVNCSKSAPRFESEIKMEAPQGLSDMCLIQHENSSSMVVVAGLNGVRSYRGTFEKLEWRISGAVGGTRKEIDAHSVTTDENGHLFVCDVSNSCIHMFSTDGLYIDTILKEGEGGMGQPCSVKWCQQTSSLFVVHYVSGYAHVNAFPLNL